MSKKWKPCTRARYWDMLEVLPPAVMGPAAFMVGEPMSHDPATGQPTFTGFKMVGNKFFEAVEPMTIRQFVKLGCEVKPYAYNMMGEYY